VIASAPSALAYGQSFDVGSSGAAPSRAVLVSLGATTHGNDMNQRHVELAVSALPGGIAVVAPPSANVAPPGHYMLFLLSADGVPSEAKIITVGTGGTPPPPPPPPVNGPPVAAFTTSPAAPQVGQQVTFTDASTDDGQVAGRAWDLDDDGQFDDGTGATATATFAAAGSYTVSLRVTDNGSPALSATTSRTVTVSASPPPPPPPPGNLVANPSFETNLTGWSGYQATLAREAQAGAPDGGFVARVTRSTGTSFTIDGGRNVASTAAATYTASAWVRAASASSVGKPIQIKLRERNAAGTVVADVGSANVALSNSWQKLTVTRAAAAGNNLGVRLSQGSAVTGNAFFADAFVVTAG
jgi:PKD repeat protein